MNLCRPLLCLLALCLSTLAHAQSPEDTGPGRLHGAVRSSNRTVLAGSALPQARRAPDFGPVPAAYPLHGITLVLRRSPAQQADLDHLLAAQQDPRAPEFHHWLTPDDFAARFGADESDLQAVERWLTTQGFTLTGRSHARDRITFAGTAAQVATAFGSPLHRIQINSEPHIAPITDLTLPTDLAAITTAILHLSDLRPHPRFRTAPHPAYTTAAGQNHFLTPADLNTMYHQTAILPGLGHSIAIVGESYLDPLNSSVAAFLSSTSPGDFPQTVLVPGTGVEAISPGDAAETDIDLEYSEGMAPNANVILVYVGSDRTYNVFDALAFAIDQKLAEVISISYGQCETFLSQTDIAQNTALFQQAALQGQTLVAASGDSGSTACARASDSSSLSAVQQQALSVDFPADSPLVTAVGGTQMADGTFTAGASPYWASASANPVGLTGDNSNSLLSYVPEIAWNEGATLKSILAGGGGESSVYPQPSWQTGFAGVPSGSNRLLPDVALQSSVASPGYIFCTDDPSYVGSQGQASGCAINNAPITGGGTSLAAPVFAALVATLNQQQASSGQGSLNPTLYRLAATSPAVFHDITAGSIACIAGSSTRCAAAGQSGFPAHSGYDEATGLGSLDFSAFLTALAPAQPSTKQHTYFLVTPQSTTLALNTPETIAVSLGARQDSPNPTPPSGSISVSIDGSVVNPALALSPYMDSQPVQVGTIAFPAVQTSGSHLVTVTYPGDATHEPTSLTTSILVGNVLATGSITLTAGNVTLPANGSGSTTVAITPAGGYNGRLFWSLAITASSNGAGITGCYSIPSVPVDGPTSTTLSLGVGTACAAAQPAARGQLRPLPALRAATSPRSTAWQPAAATTTIAAGLLLFTLAPITRRRRPASLLALFLLLAVVPAALTGCGSGSSNGETTPTPTPTPQAVTYTFSLTGQDSVNAGLSSSTTFTVTVQ